MLCVHSVIDTHNGGAGEQVRNIESRIPGALKVVY